MKQQVPGLFFLCFVLYMIVACHERSPKQKSSPELGSLKTSSSEESIIDSTGHFEKEENKKSDLPDTIPKPDQSLKTDPIDIEKPIDTSNLPLLVIENMGALWPEEYCMSTVFNRDSFFFKKAKNLFQNADLISLGSKGLQKQIIENAYCMRGECGGSQVALKLKHEEPFGILTSKELMPDKASFHLMEKRLKEDLSFGYSDTIYNFMDSSFHVVPDSSIYIQIGATGFIQENQWPMYDNIIWRLIRIKNNEQEISEWNQFYLRSTNMPKPIGIIKANDRFEIIWYHGQGLCCPSFSKAWITKVEFEEEGRLKLSDSKMYPGGIGQPCD